MTKVLKRQKTEKKTSVRYFEGLNWWILAAVFVANIFFQLSEVSSSLFLYMGTAVLIVMLFFLEKDDYIYLTVSLLSVLRYSQIFNISVINIITIVYFFRTYVFENRYKKERDKAKLPTNVVIAGIVPILVSLVHITTGYVSILIGVKLVIFLIYMVDVFRNMKDCIDAQDRFRKIQVYYVMGVLIAVFVALIINPEFSREATRMALSKGAVNQLGISLTSCLAFITLGMTKVKNIKEWFVLAITALWLLYFCFETQSRTSIIGLIFIFMSTAILGMYKRESRKWIAMMVIAAAAVLGGLILFAEGTQIHNNIMGTIERFVNPKNGDVSGGRIELWNIYLDKLMTDSKLFFFGGALSDYGNKQAHNMFIEMFASSGLLGVSLSGCLYIMVFFEIRSAIKALGRRKVELLGWVPFVLVFLMGMASHSLHNTEPTVNFCLGVGMIYLYGENDLDEDNVADNDDSGAEFITKRKRYKNIRRLDHRYSKKFRRF